MSFTHRNHYVPEWYQKRFFDPKAKEAKYHYLKLRPETKTAPNGHTYREKGLNFWGSPRCFCQTTSGSDPLTTLKVTPSFVQ